MPRHGSLKNILVGLICLLVFCDTPFAAVSSVVQAPPPAPAPNNRVMSFNFQNISTRSLIQIIAKNSGLNLIISDSVKGEMSLFLKDVTWQQALSIVLKANALGQRRYGNVLMVGPVDELASNEVKQLTAAQQLSDLAPLKYRLIKLKFANATDLANVIKSNQSTMLSPKGQIGVDVRTNSIWIQDTALRIKQIFSFISQLDIPTQQVLIEARVVTVEVEYLKNIGVRFGATVPHHLSGTLEGANQLAQGTSPANVSPIGRRLAFDVPAGSVDGVNPAGSLAIAVLKMGNNFLDLELSAMELERHAKIISSPRVVTSNQQKANIESGEEIPYQEATSSGATNIAFKKAVLSLEITPQITPGNRIVLQISVHQDKRGQTIGGPTGVPAIDTDQMTSNVFLNNGETIVIGGIYKEDDHHALQRIPFFGTLPIIGNLFRQTTLDNERSELIVFVTPKIINQKTKQMTREEKRIRKISNPVRLKEDW